MEYAVVLTISRRERSTQTPVASSVGRFEKLWKQGKKQKERRRGRSKWHRTSMCHASLYAQGGPHG